MSKKDIELALALINRFEETGDITSTDVQKVFTTAKPILERKVKTINTPHFDMVFEHIAKKVPQRCIDIAECENGVDFLKKWVSNILLGKPNKDFPFIILCGEPMTGKTVFVTAITILLNQSSKASKYPVNDYFNEGLYGASFVEIPESRLSSVNRFVKCIGTRKIIIHTPNIKPFDIENKISWIATTYKKSHIIPLVEANIPVCFIPVQQLEERICLGKLRMGLATEASVFKEKLLSEQSL